MKDFISEKERYLRKKNEQLVTAYKLALVMVGMNKKKSSANKRKDLFRRSTTGGKSITIEDTNNSQRKYENQMETEGSSVPKVLEPDTLFKKRVRLDIVNHGKVTLLQNRIKEFSRPKAVDKNWETLKNRFKSPKLNVNKTKKISSTNRKWISKDLRYIPERSLSVMDDTDKTLSKKKSKSKVVKRRFDILASY